MLDFIVAFLPGGRPRCCAAAADDVRREGEVQNKHGGETGRGEWPSLPGDVGGSEGARGEERRAAVKQKGAVKYVKSLPRAMQE